MRNIKITMLLFLLFSNYTYANNDLQLLKDVEVYNIDNANDIQQTMLNYYLNYIEENNVDILKAKLNVKQYELNYKGVKLSKNPSLSSSLSKTKTESQNKTESISVNLSYDFDLFNKIEDKEKSQLLFLEAMKNTLNETKNSIKNQFISNYMNIMLINEKIRIQKNIINLNESKLKVYQSQYHNGKIVYTEVLLIENNILNLKNSLIELINAKESYLSNIYVLLGIQNNKDKSFFIEPLNVSNIISINNKDEKLDELINNNPQVKSSYLNAKAYEYVVKNKEKEYYPTISFSLSSNSSVISLSSLLSNPLLSLLSNVSFNMNLNEIKNNIKLSEVDKETAYITYQKNYLKVFNMIEENMNKLKNLKKIYNNNLLIFHKYEKNYQIYEKQYKLGVYSYQKIIDDEINLLNSELDIISNLINQQIIINDINYYTN